MAYSMTAQGNRKEYDIRQFVCDTTADIAELPTNCAIGSSVLVVANSSVWILGSDREWHQI